MAQAMADTVISSVVPANRMSGSRAFLSAHFSRILFRARVSATPAATPLPTLTIVEAKTMRRTSLRCAPRAMRMPNSLVRCATV